MDSVVDTHEWLSHLRRCCESTTVGKLLPNAFYIHTSALSALDRSLLSYESRCRSLLSPVVAEQATLIKFNLGKSQVSYLLYPDFDTDPHPRLHTSFMVDPQAGTVTERNYSQSENPPLLHRKDAFVSPSYPLYDHFKQLTKQEESLGLLNETRTIGTLVGWSGLLRDRGLEVVDHSVVRQEGTPAPRIERHRAAIARRDFSRPVRLALDSGVLAPEKTFFDYGCGFGGDVERASSLGIESAGWDPHYRPDCSKRNADVVNLGYVLNVIECQKERLAALQGAWLIAGEVLLVSAQISVDCRSRGQFAYGDGIVTMRNTFQKYYEQEELRSYIFQSLGVEPVGIAPGVFFVFRNPEYAQNFRHRRLRTRTESPKIRQPVDRFELHRELLVPLMSFYTERGRLPSSEELPCAEIERVFGSIARAFKVVVQATNELEWENIRQLRSKDLLFYLALDRLAKPRRFSEYEEAIRLDIKAFFGHFSRAQSESEKMLFSLRDLSYLHEVCRQSRVGLLTKGGLCIHTDACDRLPPLLRLYEGCVSQTFGRPQGAPVVQLHTSRYEISYLQFADFENDPHPPATACIRVNLKTLRMEVHEYELSADAPVLHRKDAVLTDVHPLYKRYARLTRQEEAWGLFDDPTRITTVGGWDAHLRERGARIEGYRVLWRKDVDPFKKRIHQSQRRQRAQSVSPTCTLDSPLKL